LIVSHALTVDVEDWVNATVLQCTGRVTPPTEAVQQNCLRLLDLLREGSARATWFFLGDVADRFPELVRRVRDAGHEVGVHGGYSHHAVGALPAAEFRESLVRTKKLLEDAGGCEVVGYRAPDFSIDRDTAWALDVLLELGFRYDASLFPMRTPRYGVAGAPRRAHWVRTPSGAAIFEVPTTVGSLLGVRFPFAGGSYFRLLPFGLVKLLAAVTGRRAPLVFYLHPCEVERADSPATLPASLSADEVSVVRRRERVERRGRASGAAKVRRLLREFRFDTIEAVFGVRDLVAPKHVTTAFGEADGG